MMIETGSCGQRRRPRRNRARGLLPICGRPWEPAPRAPRPSRLRVAAAQLLGVAAALTGSERLRRLSWDVAPKDGEGVPC